MQVTIIIVNYNGGDLLKRCVAALQDQTFRDFHAIIVDNASKDQSIESLPPFPGSFEIIRAGSNLGFAAANNLAVRHAKTEWIALLNPDAIPQPNWVRELMTATQRYPDTVMFGSTQVNATDPSVLDGTGDVYHACGIAWRSNIGRSVAEVPLEGETFGPCAAAALYRREEFLAVGGFDERYFCYYEDVDLAFRLRLQGHRCIQVPSAIVHHYGSAIAGRYSEFTIYHGTRNRFWTFVKNIPALLLVLMLPVHCAMHMAFVLRAYSKGYAPPALRATWDMLKQIGPILATRREVQGSRRLSTWAVAAALTWSPFKLLGRASDLRPIGRD